MKPLARWNPARDVWETQTTGLFCEHSDVWSETWPPSGMWDGGTVYALPTSEHRTDGSACSSSPGLLPTPNYGLGEHRRDNGQPPERRRAQGRQVSTADVVCHLLPTPVADHSRGLPQPGTDYSSLPNAVMELLPTPMQGNRRSRKALTQRHWSAPGLEQALEIARGETPRELLPTPRAQNGNERNQTIWARDLSQPQNLENALARLSITDEEHQE